MPIEFPCPQCGRTLRTPDGSEGKRAKCPSCETVTEIPASTPPASPLNDNPFSEPASGGESENPFAGIDTGGGGGAAGANPFAGGGPAPTGGLADPQNPYASPYASESTGAVHQGQVQFRQIDFGEAFSETWRIFSSHFGMMLLAGLIFLGCSFGWNIVQNIISTIFQALLGMGGNPNAPFGGNDPFNPGAPPQFGGGGDPTTMVLFIMVQVVLGVIGMAVYAYLQAGMIRFSLSVCRGKQPDVGLIFSGAPYVLRLFLFSLLFTIVFYAIGGAVGGLLFGLGMALEDAVIPIILGSIVLIALLLAFIMFAFVPQFIIDRDEGIFEAARSSWRYMSGNFLTVFGLGLVVGFISIFAILLTCCIGYLGVIPYMFLMPTVCYLMATSQYQAPRF